MIFDALSNAAYRVSLRGPGIEIEGGVSTTPPPAGGGKSRSPAGRGLKGHVENLTKGQGHELIGKVVLHISRFVSSA